MQLLESSSMHRARGKRARVDVYKVGAIYLVETRVRGKRAIYELDFFTKFKEAKACADVRAE